VPLRLFLFVISADVTDSSLAAQSKKPSPEGGRSEGRRRGGLQSSAPRKSVTTNSRHLKPATTTRVLGTMPAAVARLPVLTVLLRLPVPLAMLVVLAEPVPVASTPPVEAVAAAADAVVAEEALGG